MAKSAKGQVTRRVATIGAAAIALLAAVAGAIDNADTVLGFIGKHLAPWVEPKAVIEITYRADPSETIGVAVAPPSATDYVSEGVPIAGREQHRFEVAANGIYKVVWQGPEVRGTSTEGIVALAPEVKLELAATDAEEGKRVLRLVQVADRAPVKVEPTVSAALLVSAGAAASAGTDTPVPTRSMLPEFDRAATIIGLFQTGTTDCSRRVFLSKFDISLGCFVASLNARFEGGTIISEIDGSDQGLDQVVGKADADALRALSVRNTFSDRLTNDELDAYEKVIERVTGTLEFWSAYDRTFLRTYARASTTARELGLESERGVLLVFNEIAFSGGIRQPVRDALTRKLAEKAAGGAVVDEAARVSGLAEALAEQANPLVRDREWYKASLDLMRTGKVSWQGIDYNLDQLGIGLTPLASNQNVTMKRFGSRAAAAPSPAPSSASASAAAASGEPGSEATTLACGDVDTAIAKVVTEKLGVDAAKVKREANFVNDLGTDDLDIVELTMEIEFRYNLELGDLRPATVGNLDDAVLKRLNCQP